MATTHAEEVARFWGLPVPSHLKHGQNTRAARTYGCDCSLCLPSGRRNRPRGQRMSSSERQKRLRAKKLGTPVPEGRHGSHGYHVYGCRCDICRAARRDAGEKKRNAWRETARGHWHTEERAGVELDVLHWPPANLDEPWLCEVCDYKIIP